MEKNLTLVNLKIVKIQPPTPPHPRQKKCLPNNSDIWIIEKDVENQHTLIQSSSKAWASQKGSIMVLK